MSKLICKVCGSAYSYCPGCVKDMNKPRWMASFDNLQCKRVFDTLVENSKGLIADDETLRIVEESGVKLAGKGVVQHVNKLKNVGVQDPVVKEQASPAPVSAPVVEEKKEEEKPLFKKNEEIEEKKEEVKHEKGLGSLFGHNASFSSNSKNQAKVKQDAGSIASAIEQLDTQQGFKGL